MNPTENMDLRHRKRERTEIRDVWNRSLPLMNLNKIVFESLAESDAGPGLQQINVARFILSEILEILAYNRDCIAANYEEFAEKDEVPYLLRIFEKLFDRIVSNTKWTSEFKTALVSQVWQYNDNGAIDFSRTQVPKVLLKTMTADRLKSVLMEALVDDSEDKNKFRHLLFTCSPVTPIHLSIIMKTLFCIFEQSSFHPTVMTFTRTFLDALQDSYSWDEFWNIFPLYLQPLFIIHKYIYCPILITGMGDSSHYSNDKLCIENKILHMLDYIYNPSNLLKRVMHRELRLDQKLLSFYIAASCPTLLPLIDAKFKAGRISFASYPSLFLYLQSQNG